MIYFGRGIFYDLDNKRRYKVGLFMRFAWFFLSIVGRWFRGYPVALFLTRAVIFRLVLVDPVRCFSDGDPTKQD